ncbi:amino acid transporter [Clostridium sp.]|uniref:amino acid transporter n=1 Tax=Clostridium sp. TaxID=1506 RepID=UPI002906F84C|nr:amino acid transporter [Clostridium sp.]MDU4480279.1 amino acid transporter [Clostridium sp.]
MNKYQRKWHKRAKLIQRNSYYEYKTCKKLARIRAVYDFYRIVIDKWQKKSLNNSMHR